MDLEKALGILEIHNRWRRGDEQVQMLNPSDIGNAIDVVTGHFKTNNPLTRESVKKKAESRDCSCVLGADRDTNFNSVIDEVFDVIEDKESPERAFDRGWTAGFNAASRQLKNTHT